ncbi:uracil-DNA glycosylase [bacterium]|nr:uracil-DNA glycosylase [bacterium]
MSEKERKLEELRKECLKCDKCSLCNTRTNIVFSDGNCDAKILLIGEAPGADEDETGTPFVGRAGKYLTQLIEESGLSRKNDFYIANTIKCRPPKNRVPSDEEKNLCEKYLLKQIEIVKPKVIVLCGATSAKSFLGDKIKITQIRGNWYKILDNIDATVILHPSFLLRKHSEEEGSARWLTRQDILKIKQFISKV